MGCQVNLRITYIQWVFCVSALMTFSSQNAAFERRYPFNGNGFQFTPYGPRSGHMNSWRKMDCFINNWKSENVWKLHKPTNKTVVAYVIYIFTRYVFPFCRKSRNEKYLAILLSSPACLELDKVPNSQYLYHCLCLQFQGPSNRSRVQTHYSTLPRPNNKEKQRKLAKL